MASTTTDLGSIMHFPPELLHKIFIFSLPKRPSFRAKNMPMLLTHVCRIWRDVALPTPALWSSVDVPILEDAPKAVDALLALWLARAGNAPLDVTFPGYLGRIGELPMDRLLRTLVPYRAQVRRMQGWFLPAADIGVNEMVNAGDVMLEFFVVHSGHTGSSVLDIGPDRPSLRRLHVCGASIDIRSVVVQQWLTRLYLTNLDPCDYLWSSVALQILMLMPALEDVTLQISPRDSPSAPVINVSNCMHSRLFVCGTQTTTTISAILDSISAPNLQELKTYGVSRALNGRDWTSLCNFLARSHSPLRVMTLFEFSATQRCLQACLACFPQLGCVSIDCHTCRGDVVPAPPHPLEEIQWRGLLPSLWVFHHNSCDSECAALAQLLESRGGVILEAGSSGGHACQDVC